MLLFKRKKTIVLCQLLMMTKSIMYSYKCKVIIAGVVITNQSNDERD